MQNVIVILWKPSLSFIDAETQYLDFYGYEKSRLQTCIFINDNELELFKRGGTSTLAYALNFDFFTPI